MKIKNKIIPLKGISEKLNVINLEYNTLLLEEFKINKLKEEEKKEQEEKEVKYIKNMWKVFHSLKDKKLIEDIFKISKELIEKEQSISFFSLNELSRNLRIKEYFIKKGIDTTYVFEPYLLSKTRSKLLSDNELDYFREYSFNERLRWEKIRIKLEKKIRKI